MVEEDHFMVELTSTSRWFLTVNNAAITPQPLNVGL